MYAVYHGPKGLKDIAERVDSLSSSFAQSIVDAGLEITSQHFFDTVTVSGVDAQKIKADLGVSVRTEGMQSADWVLLDAGDVPLLAAHFLAAVRFAAGAP
jgi:glycine cleavage system pyridoxal-binding protein P